MLFAGVLALALCAAVTRQPGDFTHRHWAGLIVIGLAAVYCAVTAARVGIAAPLTAGLALAALYSLAYDPVLPDSVANALPTSLALLEPTVPMLLALVFIVWWIIFALTHRRKIDDAPALALGSLSIVAGLLLGVAVILYVALSRVYDLEGGAILWKFVLMCFLYLNLMWIGLEATARRMFTWPVAVVLLLGMIAGFVHNLIPVAGGAQ